MRVLTAVRCTECESANVRADHPINWAMNRLGRLNSEPLTLKIGDDAKEAAAGTVLLTTVHEFRSPAGERTWRLGIAVYDRPMNGVLSPWPPEDLSFLEPVAFVPKSQSWTVDPQTPEGWGRIQVTNPDGTTASANVAL